MCLAAINTPIIIKAEQIKLLGVIIDNNLNFTEHISEICTKARKKVGVFNCLLNLVPCRAKLLLQFEVLDSTTTDIISSTLC